MKRRKFEFVVFWDQCAWVAGTTSYNAVTQGSTLHEAVKSLGSVMRMYALIDVENHRPPFTGGQNVMVPIGEMSSTKGAIDISHASGRPDKKVRYCGTLDVTWDSQKFGLNAPRGKRK